MRFDREIFEVIQSMESRITRLEVANTESPQTRLLAVARAARALEGAYELEYPPNEEANRILAEFVAALAAVEDLL